MSHSVQAFVISPPFERCALRHLRSVCLRPMQQQTVLVPVTDALFDETRAAFPSDIQRPFEEFWKLSGSLELLARGLSAEGLVAYIETDYFGGAGWQAAAVWSGDMLVMSPTRGHAGVINAALRMLGVRAVGSADEFETLGLHQHRHTEDWARDGVA